MTAHELKRRYPNASESFIRANCDKGDAQSPELELPIYREPVGQKKGEAGDSGRVCVRVESVRTRLIDPDNLCPKYFVDCLRYAEIIQDDRPEDIELICTQRKIRPGEEAHTMITISARQELAKMELEVLSK